MTDAIEIDADGMLPELGWLVFDAPKNRLLHSRRASLRDSIMSAGADPDLELPFTRIDRWLINAMAMQIVILNRRVGGLEARLQSIEVPKLKYRGVYRRGQQYAKGDTATHAGALWHSNEDGNQDKPGTSKAWTLCAKGQRK